MSDDSTGRPCPYPKALLIRACCGAHCVGVVPRTGDTLGGYHPRYVQIALHEYDYRL